MSLQPSSPSDLIIPEETAHAARAAFPRGNRYLRLRDELGTLFEDEDFAALYSHRGQPTYSPWRLALVTVVQYLENLPDRQAAEAVRARLDWKYALGLSLSDPGFDASILCEFRSRLTRAGAETLFLDAMLERLQEAGLVKARGRQRTDSTHVLADVRELSRLELVGETLRAALNELAEHAPDWLRAVAQSSWYERYMVRALRPTSRGEPPAAGQEGARGLRPPYRHRRVPSPRRDGSKRRAGAPSEPSDGAGPAPGVERAVRALRAGGGASLPRAARAPSRTYDPDAGYRTRSGTPWTGYMVHLSETCDEGTPRIVTNVLTTTADVHEARCTARIHEALALSKLVPSVHLADAAYIDAGHLVEAEEEYGIRLVGPARKDPSWQAKVKAEAGMAVAHTKDQFEVNWKEKIAVCPEGKRSASWGEYTDKARGDYVSVRFSARDCRACPSKPLCTEGESRSLLMHPEKEHRALERTRELMQTKEGKRLYALRSGIEGTVSQGVRAMGLRRTRYRGLAKTRLGHVATAAALNLARVGSWLGGVPPAKTRTSRFLRLVA